ncbi:hypothetical protein P152DRAFT_457092 [Eremomyces bilateralis CBS 781.70]|uniref:Intracellular protein transport protein n=1 Tax=Eremomyces bilateralis CBS 781.70 TaxID=1392243 RepID=A0A6G1G6R0_9PEZI|nr:uncharacterized protein P152DRAFT_457092 [Eremomyces bilateralis CBS 781.70]KAF1813728.1 hypothetical protein P152DRAFT_457092 [Eremomyces bilateralis CBS 781.70]
MLRVLESQAPPKQTATDTINTLSGRLLSATLLEDRRAAILGLRSFAKEYPASVASGALRGLISSLTKDAEDVDTLKIVLETLLMLFRPNHDSPEASDDITLWLADEFTQRQDNITLLLDFLETSDFYSRLYSIQLISAIQEARLERTQECILSAPLGTTRLASMLKDPRDAVRNASILLLTDLTTSSNELQKLVAFEGAFEQLFALIDEEGALNHGGIVVQDCLSLLANLLRHNSSNQSLFRETGCISKLGHLLPEGPLRTQKRAPQPDEEEEEDDDAFPNPQRDKNIWGILAVLRMFLVKGSLGTQQNQNAFFKNGLLQQVLNLAFKESTLPRIRAEALSTCADMIWGNAPLQEHFAQLLVTPFISFDSSPDTRIASPADSLRAPNGTSRTQTPNGQPRKTSPQPIQQVYVIEALLDLTLRVSTTTLFDVRFAAAECIKAYFSQHTQIKMHFLNRAIDGYSSGEDETANVVSILMQRESLGSSGTVRTHIDPYRQWFAAVLLFHLIQDDPDAKALLQSVKYGNSEEGEEEVTFIQEISGQLIYDVQQNAGAGASREIMGYLMLLCGLLFEDGVGVNDFLSEGSTLQILMAYTSRALGGTATGGFDEHTLLRGMCAVLLGIVYEFSTKDSPLPRRKLQSVLLSGLGREKFLDALNQLRQHPLLRDFEVLPQSLGSVPPNSGTQPEVFFDSAFVEFLKDTFIRITKAIDRDPGMEVQVTHIEGVDRDILDSLRSQLEDKADALQKSEDRVLDLERKLDQEIAGRRKESETASTEVTRVKNINEALQTNHESELDHLTTDYEQRISTLESQLAAQKHDLENQMLHLQKNASDEAARAKATTDRELDALRRTNAELEQRAKEAEWNSQQISKAVSELSAAANKTRDNLTAARHSLERTERTLKTRETELAEVKREFDELKETSAKDVDAMQTVQAELDDQRAAKEDVEGKVKTLEAEVEETEQKRKEAQTELDDLLMILADLEEKRASDKKRLKELGEEVSDAEDNEDDEDENEVD